MLVIYKYVYREIYPDNLNRFDGWVIDINIFCKKPGPWVTSFSQSTLNKIRTLENVHHIINTRFKYAAVHSNHFLAAAQM